MTEADTQDELWMVRDDLRDFPRYEVPAPYRARSYETGDDERWVEIHEADDLNRVDRQVFCDEFGPQVEELPRRMLFVVDGGGRAIATVTAWTPEPSIDPRYGRLHWVAVARSAQGRGLGNVLVSLGLERIAALGYSASYLTTSPARSRAVSLYRKFGFVVGRPPACDRSPAQRRR